MGEPSIELMTSMGDDEKERVEKQRSTLGKKGLMKKADELEEATDKNEVRMREGVIRRVWGCSTHSCAYFYSDATVDLMCVSCAHNKEHPQGF